MAGPRPEFGTLNLGDIVYWRVWQPLVDAEAGPRRSAVTEAGDGAAFITANGHPVRIREIDGPGSVLQAFDRSGLKVHLSHIERGALLLEMEGFRR